MAKDLLQYSDEQLYDLLRDARRADEAFQLLYDRMAPGVFRYCRRILGHQELAEDVFQETFVRFYRSATERRTMTNVQAFVLKIARNLCLNAKSSKYYGLASLENVDVMDPGTSYDNKQLLEIIGSAVECLPIDFREVFVLREYEGLSYGEIAEVLEISIPTVKIRLFRAKRQIRDILSPYVADLAI